MKFYRKTFQRKKIKALVFLLVFLIIPFILSSSMFAFNNNIQEKVKEDDFNEMNYTPEVSGPPNDNYFRYYKVITIDNSKVSGTGSHTNFPVLISLFDSDLRNNVQSNGNDIAFSDGTDWLDHEIEVYNQNYNNTHAKFVAWVRIPSLSTTVDTVIYMYYCNSTMGVRENPTGVWSSNYQGVWHMKEDPSGSAPQILDSTSNNRDCTSYGSMNLTDQVTGQIDGSLDFDGSDDYTQWSSVITQTTGSYSMWIYPHSISGERNYIANDAWQSRIALWDDVVKIETDTDAEYFDFTLSSISANVWTHIVFVRAGDVGDLYVNGSLVQQVTETGADALTVSCIGGTNNLARMVDGVIDEVQITNNARTGNWIATEYNNQIDPDSFYSVSSANRINAPSFNDFRYYKEITVDNTKVSGTGSHANYPLLISLFDSDLRIDAQSNGNDIAFSDGSDWLDHEIEQFDQAYNLSHAHLVAWVRIPSLSSSVDTRIRMYYGNTTMGSQENPNGVWDPNYVGVWHLKESGSGVVNEYGDSSKYGNHGQGGLGNITYVPSRTAGPIGFGQDFSDHFIDCGNDTSIDITSNQITLQLWMKFPATHPWMGPFNHKGYYNGYRLAMAPNSQYLNFHLRGQDYNLQASQTTSPDTWHYVVATYDSALMRIFVDGIEDPVNLAKTDNILSALPYPFRIGHGDHPEGVPWTYPWLGQIDEVRISNVAYSADWITTEYNNQYAPNSFYSVSNADRVNAPSFNDFEYFKEIAINNTKVIGTGSHNDFPVLISLFDSDLRTDVQSDGGDIAFTDGITWLDHEIELFNQTYNSTHAQLVAWVRIPNLSTSEDTIIRMYFGNPTMEDQEWIPRRVWDSSYRSVWHLSEDPSGTINDSTLNRKDGTSSGSMTSNDLIAGKINGGIDFDGIDDTINVGPWSSSKDFNPDSGTISFWISRQFLDSVLENQVVLTMRYTGINRIMFRYDGGGNEWRFHHEGNDTQAVAYTPAGDIPRLEWVYVVQTWDVNSNFIKGYVDGSLYVSTSGLDYPETASYDVYLASNRNSDGYYDGKIDEIRVSGTYRTDGWITTEYNNQNDPYNFYSIGDAIKVVNDAPSNAGNFKYYKEIIIDRTKIIGEGYYTNFPMLINLTDSDLRNDVQLDGDDIAFSLSNAWLDHEIELFDQTYSPTHAHLVAWVRIPKLSTSIDTIIRMYYGNPTLGSQENSTAVWGSNYMGVWHLSESSGLAQDSTSYDEDGAVSGVTQGMNGQIDGAYDFNLDERVTVGDPSDGHLDFGMGSFTISFWLNIDQSTANGQIPIYKGGTSSGTTGYSLVTSPNGEQMWPVISDGLGNQVRNEYSISFDTWTYWVMIVDRSTNLIKSYKSGLEVDSDDISSVGSVSNSYGLTFSHSTFDYDGLLDEVRIIDGIRSPDWILTEYSNQYNTSNFYSIGSEQTSNQSLLSSLQVNAVDLYGHSIPYVNISMYNKSKVIKTDIANANGSVLFTDLQPTEYNFTVTMKSNINSNLILIINETSKGIMINETFQILNLVCNVSRNTFYIEDVDGAPLDSGWIVVGNSSDDLQNCTIDESGNAIFRWLNTTGYNYTVWYRDDNYNPNKMPVASGDILTQNSQIDLTANLTTVNFTIWTIDGSQPVSGVKMILNNNATSANIINLTTNINGKATLRWATSSTLGGNYSLTLSFYAEQKRFNMSGFSTELKYHIDFSVTGNVSYDIWIELTTLEVKDYATELVSLNPSDYIEIDWGSQLKLMSLFNVTKAVGAPQLLGPKYADSMSYQITLAGNPVKSGTMPMDLSNVGRHYTYINTDELESDAVYVITISAFKSGFTIPSALNIILNILEHEVIFNQSQNDDSAQITYWSEVINMSVKAYGKNSESFTYEENLVKDENHWFNFSIPDLSTDWNLSRIVFNVYNITFGVNVANINLTITDDYGKKYIFNSSDSSYYYYNSTAPNGRWIDLELNLNQRSVSENNTFNFIFDGTFVGNIDVVSNVYLIRDKINVQYSKFNITDDISIFAAPEGWAIKNIAFEIYNCYDTSTWAQVDLSNLSSLNITTNLGFKKSLDQGYSNGTGLLIIGNRVIYPLQDQFLFTIDHSMNIMFDVNISVEYIQEFYKNQHLESYNLSIIKQNITNGGNFAVSASEDNWVENSLSLLIDDIKNGTNYFFPSELAMNITIEGVKYSISDTLFGGTFSLDSFSKNKVYTAKIETSQPVNFTASFILGYTKARTYEIKGILTYSIKEYPLVNGTVQYDEDLGCYIQFINTALVNVDKYTVSFSFIKTNHIPVKKDLTLIVLNRPTLLNGSTDYFRVFDEIYALEAVNYTFSYIDSLTNQPIMNLQQQSFVWEKYDEEGKVVKTGNGNMVTKGDSYVLDLNTEKFTLGEYLIIINLDKDNYDYKVGLIYLMINERPTLLNGSFSLGTIYDEIDITTEKNYSYSYVDYLTSAPITNLLNQSYSYTSTSQVDPSGQGTLYFSSSNVLYILDFNTETRANGTYTIIIVLGKENYTTQTTTLVLKIISNIPLIPVELEVFNYTTNIEFPVNTISMYWNITFSLSLRFTEFNSGLPISGATVTFTWECGSGKILSDNSKGPGFYSFEFYTGNATDIGTYTVDFVARKEAYSIGTPNPKFIINIIDRPTELNSSRRVLYVNQKLYVRDSYNFIFEYFDVLTSQIIADADDFSYILQKLDNDGNPIEEETTLGFLYKTINNRYILDLDTEKLREGDYSVIVSIKKRNYAVRIAIISLTISKREFGAEFSEGQFIRIASGGTLQIQMTLTDPNNNSVPIIGATIYLTLEDVRHDFTDHGDGTYSINIPDIAEAFFSPKTIIIQGSIEKANFTTQSFSITTVIKMEEIIPGIPFFYFILVGSAIAAFSASIAVYKIYKYATIPEFVKKARAMKKAILKEKAVSESLIYQEKVAFIGERVKDKWDKIGLSFSQIQGVKIEKVSQKRRISEEIKIPEFRPLGLLLMRWDERIGAEMLMKYPEELVTCGN
ncbi:MAG: DUF2341 domain-containing protein [Promethearchaeota archaeon]|jgi:hypothetical protein